MEIVKKYLAGGFTRVSLENLQPTVLNRTISAPSVDTTPVDEVYVHRTNNNTLQTFHATNQKAFTGMDAKEKKRCNRCHLDFYDEPTGLPILDDCFLTKEGDVEQRVMVYHTDGVFHSFECAMGCLENELSKSFLVRDSVYANSEYLLKSLFHRLYPNERLEASPEPRLLKVNGGSLSEEEYLRKSHRYVKTNNIIIQPVKTLYKKERR